MKTRLMSQEPQNTRDPDLIVDDERPLKTRRIRQRNLVLVVAAVALVALTLIILILWRWKRSAAESEAEVTPTVSVKVVKAEKGRYRGPGSCDWHYLAARKG